MRKSNTQFFSPSLLSFHFPPLDGMPMPTQIADAEPVSFTNPSFPLSWDFNCFLVDFGLEFR